jgi:transposase
MEVLRQAPGEAARRELAVAADGPPPSRWTLRAVRASLPWLRAYTLGGVWRVLRRAGLGVRPARLQRYSPDPAYAEKLVEVERCLGAAGRAPGRVVALFLDEMGYTRWPDPGPAWAPGAPAPAPEAACAGPNRQWRVVGALNALTGAVHYRDNYVVGREQLGRFYRQLDAAYPAAEVIYVIQDNWSVHQHEEVLAAVAALPRLRLVWLPTYASWLNPIEKLWRWARGAVLKVHRLAGDFDALRRRVRAFFDQFAAGSEALLTYVGLRGDGRLARALRQA